MYVQTDDGPNYTAACLDYAGIYTDEDRLNRQFGYTDFWILPEGVSTVLNFEDETPAPSPSEDNYTVDLGGFTDYFCRYILLQS